MSLTNYINKPVYFYDEKGNRLTGVVTAAESCVTKEKPFGTTLFQITSKKCVKHVVKEAAIEGHPYFDEKYLDLAKRIKENQEKEDGWI
ncbi:hypothetical protein vBAmePPT11V19_00040 [Alteromonas phage vB_AmeP_PT11-V19]|nr:hypothetical protein vBAmePPT11V19_00040 [Alteromonas phage vB_AmeP_PT11-V19]